MARHNYRIELAYDGSAFAGFQRQPGLQTVESEIERALDRIGTGRRGPIVPGGRTDRGVHATGQVVSLWTDVDLHADDLATAIDSVNPGLLAVLDARRVGRWFHARWSARSRRYVYLVADGGELDAARIDRLLLPLTGRRDFTSFARDTRAGASSVRTLIEARARRDGPDLVRFDFAAEGFLRKQVRVLVATAVREARAGAPDDRLLEIAEARDRLRTAPPAGAGGLYLTRVSYSVEGWVSRDDPEMI